MRLVWIDEFQHASGGEAFAVGDRVTWRVLPPDPAEIAWKTDIFGPEAGHITDLEEHHNLIDLTTELTGTVRAIRWAVCDLEADPSGKSSGTLVPINGSGQLIPKSSAAKGARSDEGELSGFVVGVDEQDATY